MNMKNVLNGLKCAAWVVLTTGLALGGWAAEPVEYLEPVYKTAGVPASGIDHWETKSVSDYSVVASSESAVTWGESGKTNWYVATDANVGISNGIVCKGFVNLILCKGAKLTVEGASGCAGIQTDDNGAFVIYGTPQGEGELSATGGYNGAGIGGSDNVDACIGSHITINGGKVTAQTAGYKAAGIGSGMNSHPGYDITINGGTVIAQSQNGGAGIGGSVQGEGHDITINAGRVLACSGKSAAIGGGRGPSQDDYCYENAAGHNITINGGSVCVSGQGDVIGSRVTNHPAHDNRIAAGANVLFCLDAGLEEPIELTESMVLVGSAGSLEGLNYTLAGGLVGFGIETLTMTNATTHETQTVTVGGEALVPFSGKKAAVRVSDGFAKLFVGQPIEATPTAVGHAKITGVYTNGVLSSESSPWTVWTYEPAFVVYEAESGLVFQNGLTVMTNMLDTTVSPAVSTQPLPSILQDTPVAKLYDAEGAAKGFYDSLAKAIAGAQKGETVVLLTNLQESVTFTGAFAVTLDLAGWTLTSSGSAPIIKVAAEGAALTIRDTSAAKTGSITTGGKTYSGDGAGIYVVEKSSLSMYGVVITNCVASGNGGAIYGEKNARILLKDCTVKDNVAGESGGGIYKNGSDNGGTEPSDKLVLLSTEITGNTSKNNGGGVYFCETVKGTGGDCLVAGTMVRLADGSEKAVEEILEGDVVRTFDHEAGTNSTARIYFTYKGTTAKRPLTLTFEGGFVVGIVGGHDFLEQSTRKYVTISEANVGQYVGAKFYGEDGAWHALSSAKLESEPCDFYEIYSAQHQNVYANGLLNVADDVDYLLNVYALDEGLKADADQLAADVAAYGYLPYEEAGSLGMSRAWYDDAGTKYLNVAIGKQLVSKAHVEQLFASTGRATIPPTTVQRPASTILAPLSSVLRPLSSTLSAGPVMATVAEPKLDDYADVGCLTLGGSTVVTNNTVSGKANNVYLDKNGDDNSYICFVGEDGTRAGMCVGVTLAWTSGQFTTLTANQSDVGYFRDDTGTYAVWYANEGSGPFLKLDNGSQIVPPAVAHTTAEIFVDGVSKGSATSVAKNTSATVVYTADVGYVFDGSGATNKEVSVGTSTSIATMTPPDAPFEPVASVTTNGVTTVYGTLTGAWADATTLVKDVDVLVTLLKDATVDATLVRESSGKILTLDLNDKVLAYVGATDVCVISQKGGASMHIVDTATTRTPRYFTCDATTGLWTRANEATDLAVTGGLITGGRASALYVSYGGASISNVNFVGNSSAGSGGAVSVTMGSLSVAKSSFFGNVSGENGGAISSVGACEMSDCRVESNVATNLGGGVYMRLSGSLVRTSVVGNKAGTGGGVYLTFSPSCFPAGVKILMADGSEKNVEDIVKGDVVATFDHVGGTNSSSAVYDVYGGTGSPDTFKLTFSSGATLEIADRHDLLLEATRKYVTVSSDNARQFIGKRFYNYTKGCWDKLTGVTAVEGGEEHYSIYTRGHANCVANGLLTVPDDKDFYLNVYELDANLKADAAQLAADIATYGLATPADYPNVPLDDFEDGNIRYARIAIGKGLTTQAEILYWNEFDYGPIVTKKQEPSAPKLMMSAAPMTLTAGLDAVAAAPKEPYLKVGEGTVVTGNVTTAGATSNVYLKPDRGKTPVIDILPDTTDLDIGVTLSTGTGVFGWTNGVNYASSFTSDSSEYSIVYTADKTLELVPFVEVVPTVVAHTVAEVYQGETKLETAPYLVPSNAAPVTVVYTTDPGYYFDKGGTTAVTNAVDTAKNPATADAPQAPFFAVARSVKTDGGSPVTSYHTALTEAIDAIGANGVGTVTMLADVALVQEGSDTLPNGIDLTFDLAGKKIDWRTTNGDALFYFASGSTGRLVLGDSGIGGTISSYCDSSEVTNSALIAYCDGDGDLTVNGGTFVCSNKVGAATLFFKRGSGTWTFNDGTYKALGEGAGGAHFLYCASATGTTHVAGGTYDIRATASAGAGIASNEECFDKITVTDGDFDVITTCAWGGAFSCGNGSLLVDGGDFCVTSSVAGVSCILAERKGTTVLSNGTFYCETTDGYAYAACANGMAKLTIAGGTYSSKAFKDTAATVVCKEQSMVTLVGSPVINNGATEGTAWNLAVQLWGSHFDFSGYTGANLPSFAVFADGTYGASFVKGDMTRFDSASIWAGYFSTHPYDWTVLDDHVVVANEDASTKAAYPWVVVDGVRFTPATVEHAPATVLTNGAPTALKGDNYYLLPTNAANVKVVYAAETGYFFADRATAVTNDVDTTKNPATADAPAEPVRMIRVGDNAWAQVAGGICTVFGTGDMWNIDGWPSGVNPLAAYRKAIANVVVESGVTSVGQAMLYKFYAVTNVTIAAGVTNIADHAFYNCHSLQGITFLGDTPALGEQAIKFTTAIRMDGDTPVVYTIPEVTSPKRKLMGKKDLADAAWTEITDLPAKSDYRFFKVVVE